MGRTGFGAVVLCAMVLAAPAVAAARTIRFAVQTQVERAQFVDNEPPGASAGDLLVFTERLLDSSGEQIGSDSAVCVRLFDERSLCTGTYVLHGGQVFVQLLQPGRGHIYSQAITGGTGRFAGARGTVTVRQGDGVDRLMFRIRVD
jgi:hypothetical protein